MALKLLSTQQSTTCTLKIRMAHPSIHMNLSAQRHSDIIDGTRYLVEFANHRHRKSFTLSLNCSKPAIAWKTQPLVLLASVTRDKSCRVKRKGFHGKFRGACSGQFLAESTCLIANLSISRRRSIGAQSSASTVEFEVICFSSRSQEIGIFKN